MLVILLPAEGTSPSAGVKIPSMYTQYYRCNRDLKYFNFSLV